MKTKLLFIIIALLSSLSTLSQIPQGFNYQAIARDSDGKEIVNTTMQIRLSVLSDTNGYYSTGLGVAVWEEEQSITTNSFGLFSIVFGNTAATRIRGTVDHFSDISWKAHPLFIGTKIRYLGDWRIMGSARLWSVPYSMLSGDLSGPVKKLEVTADTASAMDEALFEVKNRKGQTVLAIYNEGVRIYVDDGVAKAGKKGGFAIGSFGTAKSVSQPLLIVDPDSIRAYVYDDTLTKGGLKGGFAIGGFNGAKGITNDYLVVSPDSIRAYISASTGKAGKKGGFAIGSFNNFKGYGSNYLSISSDSIRLYTRDTIGKAGFQIKNLNSLGSSSYMNLSGSSNIRIGEMAGLNINDIVNSFANTLVGNQSGKNISGGHFNVMLGYETGMENINGSANVFLGSYAGRSNTSGKLNSFDGYMAGYANKTGYGNSFFGSMAGFLNDSGIENTFIGCEAGYSNISGGGNFFAMPRAGYFNSTGGSNIYIGTRAGYNNPNGNTNMYIGSFSGYYTNGGTQNIFIGSSAGDRNNGSSNIAIGYAAGSINKSGFGENICIGLASGCQDSLGSRNVYIGKWAGYNNYSGSQNVFIGNEAGYDEPGSKKLYISCFRTSAPLIYGDFAWGILNFNAKVGIGTNSPQSNLEVIGQDGIIIRDVYSFDKTSLKLLNDQNTNNRSLEINYMGSTYSGGEQGLIKTTGNYPLNFGINNLARLTIANTGNIGIGTTTPSSDFEVVTTTAPGNKVAIFRNMLSNAGTTVSLFNDQNLNTHALDLNYMGGSYSGGEQGLIATTGSYPLNFGTANSVRLSITSSGNIGIGVTVPSCKFQVGTAGDGSEARANAWNLLSDENLKTGLVKPDNPLQMLSNLNGYYFYWNTGSDKARQFGFSAQEVKNVLPEIVSKGSDGFLSVDYGKITPLLVEAIKNQQKQIEAQKSEIQSLRDEMEHIKILLAAKGEY